MKNEEIEGLEANEKAATPGPWFIQGGHMDYAIFGNQTGSDKGWAIADNVIDLDARRKQPDVERQVRDAALILALRNAAPALLARARRANELEALVRVVADVPIENLSRLLEPVDQGGPRVVGCIHCGMAAPEHGPNCSRPRTIEEALSQHCAPGRDFRVAVGFGEEWRSIPPHDLVLHCPACGKQHLDVGEFETRVHRKHLCEDTPEGQKTGCGHVWAPFQYATRGVLRLPMGDNERIEELDKLRMSLEAADPPSCTVIWWETGYDGPGWYYYDTEYSDEGAAGAFKELAECVLHAAGGGYIIGSIDGPPALPKKADEGAAANEE